MRNIVGMTSQKAPSGRRQSRCVLANGGIGGALRLECSRPQPKERNIQGPQSPNNRLGLLGKTSKNDRRLEPAGQVRARAARAIIDHRLEFAGQKKAKVAREVIFSCPVVSMRTLLAGNSIWETLQEEVKLQVQLPRANHRMTATAVKSKKLLYHHLSCSRCLLQISSRLPMTMMMIMAAICVASRKRK